MKIAFKNFITTLKRYKAASLLNLFGLAMAFVAFYIIMVQVYSAMTFNRSIKDSEQVYFVTPYHEALGGWSSSIPNPISYETAEELPIVEGIVSMCSYINEGVVWFKPDGGNYEKRYANVVRCNSPLLDVFSFEIVAGNADDFKQMDAAVVSESIAKAAGITVGSVINLEEGELKPGRKLTVVAIYKDFADNTILHDRHIFHNDNREYGMDNSNWNYSVFVKLREGSDPADYVTLWQKKFFEFNEQRYAQYVAATGKTLTEKEKSRLFNMPLKLVPLDDMYFGGYEDYPSASHGTITTMFAIVLIIVIVAFINFINFFMALVPVRMRSVNICKVFGADGKMLRWNFVFEAMGLVVIALAMALCIVTALDGGFINEYITAPLAVSKNLKTVGIVLAVALVMAVMAAVYPAFYITHFNASLAVRKGFSQSKAGRMLRYGLVAMQFFVSIVLMILALVFSAQYSYMVRYNIGIERENLLEISSFELNSKSELFIEALERNPHIAAATAVNNSLFGHTHSEQVRMIEGKQVEMNLWFVRYNAPELLGIDIIAGEGFTKDKPGFIITDYTAQATGLGIGDKWDNIEIVGIIPHINFKGANSPKINTMLRYFGSDAFAQTYYVRLNRNVDIESVCKDIKRIAREIEPEADEPNIQLAYDSIAEVYGETKKQTVIIAMFALIAVVISLMGVFGIVLFETQHRRSEIAVRKVYGATSYSVVEMFNRRYMKIVIACFIVATPIAYLTATYWLQQFVNRIELSAWFFVAVFAATTAIVVTIVTLRSYKAATENPADVVKSI